MVLILKPSGFVPAKHWRPGPCWPLKLSGIGCFGEEQEEDLGLLITYICLELVSKAFSQKARSDSLLEPCMGPLYFIFCLSLQLSFTQLLAHLSS